MKGAFGKKKPDQPESPKGMAGKFGIGLKKMIEKKDNPLKSKFGDSLKLKLGTSGAKLGGLPQIKKVTTPSF
jgi:hypothetical protein